MEKVIAEPLLALTAAGALATMDTVAATLRNPALLFDVQMDQLPGPLTLATHFSFREIGERLYVTQNR